MRSRSVALPLVLALSILSACSKSSTPSAPPAGAAPPDPATATPTGTWYTPTATPSPSSTPTATSTFTVTGSATATPTASPTITLTATVTSTPTFNCTAAPPTPFVTLAETEPPDAWGQNDDVPNAQHIGTVAPDSAVIAGRITRSDLDYMDVDVFRFTAGWDGEYQAFLDCYAGSPVTNLWFSVITHDPLCPNTCYSGLASSTGNGLYQVAAFPAEGNHDFSIRLAWSGPSAPGTSYRLSLSAPPTPTATPTATPTDTATPTHTPCGTPAGWFGASTAPFSYGDFNDILVANPYPLTMTGKVARLAVYLGAWYAPEADDRIRVGIYSDSASAPNALLTQSDAAAVTQGWNRVEVTPTVLGPGLYWLAIFMSSNGTGRGVDYSSNAGPAPAPQVRRNLAFGPMPNPFGPTDGYKYLCYPGVMAEYCDP